MNKLKSVFIGLFPMISMVISGYSIYQLTLNGFSYIWLGAILTTLPILLFISRILIFKDMPRTSAHFPVLIILAVAGIGITVYEIILHGFSNLIGVICVITGFLTFLIYDFWYSKLERGKGAKIKVGEQLSNFVMYDSKGVEFEAKGFIGNPAIFIFYRGNWCPLCMAQIKELASKYRELQETGAKIILISPQSQKKTRELAQRFDVPFLFLRDDNNQAAKILGLEMKSGLPMGLEIFGYEKDTVLPTVIITDGSGKIIYNDATENYRIRPEPEEFIKVLSS